MSRTLTCYAIGHTDEWEAFCVDLDLAVQGRSFREVYDMLNEVICDYIESAKLEQPEQAARLLSRSAPWHVRARLAARFMWGLLHRPRSDDDDHAATFPVSCPA